MGKTHWSQDDLSALVMLWEMKFLNGIEVHLFPPCHIAVRGPVAVKTIQDFMENWLGHPPS